MNAGDGFGRDSGAPVRAARALKRVHSLGGFSGPASTFSPRSRVTWTSCVAGGCRCPRILRGRAEGEDGAPGAGGLSRCPRAPPQRPVAWKSPRRGWAGRAHLPDRLGVLGMNDPMWDLPTSRSRPGSARARPHHDGGLLRGQLFPELYSRLEIYKAMSDPALVRVGFRPAREGQPR